MVSYVSLVTQSTSLLVPETLEQYLKYKVTPPKMLSELRDQYTQLIAQEEARFMKVFVILTRSERRGARRTNSITWQSFGNVEFSGGTSKDLLKQCSTLLTFIQKYLF